MKIKLSLQELETLLHYFFPFFAHAFVMRKGEYQRKEMTFEQWLEVRVYFSLLADLEMKLQQRLLHKKAVNNISLKEPEAIVLYKAFQILPSQSGNVWMQVLIGRIVGELDQQLQE